VKIISYWGSDYQGL